MAFGLLVALSVALGSPQRQFGSTSAGNGFLAALLFFTMHLDANGTPLSTTTASDHLPRFPPSGDDPLRTN